MFLSIAGPVTNEQYVKSWKLASSFHALWCRKDTKCLCALAAKLNGSELSSRGATPLGGLHEITGIAEGLDWMVQSVGNNPLMLWMADGMPVSYRKIMLGLKI